MVTEVPDKLLALLVFNRMISDGAEDYSINDVFIEIFGKGQYTTSELGRYVVEDFVKTWDGSTSGFLENQ